MSMWNQVRLLGLRLFGAPEQLAIYDLEILKRQWAWILLRRQDPTTTELLWQHRMAAHAERVWEALREEAPQRTRHLVSDGLYQSLCAQQEIGYPYEHVSCGRPPLYSINLDVIEQIGPYTVAVARPWWNRHPVHPTLSWAVAGKWFYMRRAGAGAAQGEAWEQRCPRCGAELEIADRVRCTHCGAIVNSGEHDWILTGIAEGEHEYEVFAIPGLDELRARDPHFATPVVEDRAAALFWALRQAERGGLGAIEKVQEWMVEGVAPPLRPVEGMPFLKDLRVQLIEPGEVHDRLHARVRWVEKGEPRVERWVLQRPRGASSFAGRGLNSLGCQACGAPLSPGGGCDHCGSPQLMDAEWRLVEVHAHEADPERRMVEVEANLPPAAREAIVGALATFDRDAQQTTWLLRRTLGRVFGLPMGLAGLLKMSYEAAASGLDSDNREFLFDLATFALVDGGPIDKRGSDALERLASALGLPGDRVVEALRVGREVQQRSAIAKPALEARQTQ